MTEYSFRRADGRPIDFFDSRAIGLSLSEKLPVSIGEGRIYLSATRENIRIIEKRYGLMCTGEHISSHNYP